MTWDIFVVQVGTGFSFTNNDAGYATTEIDVAANLYKALVQFFKLFPHLDKTALYLTGEVGEGIGLIHFVKMGVLELHCVSHSVTLLLAR